jgi:hypothetical protein
VRGLRSAFALAFSSCGLVSGLLRRLHLALALAFSICRLVRGLFRRRALAFSASRLARRRVHTLQPADTEDRVGAHGEWNHCESDAKICKVKLHDAVADVCRSCTLLEIARKKVRLFFSIRLCDQIVRERLLKLTYKNLTKTQAVPCQVVLSPFSAINPRKKVVFRRPVLEMSRFRRGHSDCQLYKTVVDTCSRSNHSVLVKSPPLRDG